MLKTMSFLLVLSLLLLDLVSAAPHKSLEKRTFRVNRYQSKGSPNAVKAMRKVYNKWGLTLPEGLVPNAQQSSLGNVHAANNSGVSGQVINTPEPNDVEYLSRIKVGGQELTMNFDTGSSDLWMFSSKLRPDEAKEGHDIFDPAKSSTFKPMAGGTFRISFGDGSFALGEVGTDTVDIGGATVTEQAVQLATTVSDAFTADQNSDGIVGLGFGKINTVKQDGKPKPQKTFFENIMSDLKEPIFSAQLKKAEKGFYEFGKIDSSAFSGELHKVPVNDSAGFWQIESAYFQVGDGPVFHNPIASPAIADTGTTLLLVDNVVAEKYYEKVKNATLGNGGMYTFPCEAALPDFHIGLGPEYRAKIDGTLMKFQEVTSTNTCIGSMQPNSDSGLQIYGDILFKAQFAVFNIADKTIGFADHA